MSKLSILGAQRIKALSEMIDEQCKREVQQESQFMTTKEAIEAVMSKEELEQYESLTQKLQETIEELNSLAHLTGKLYGHSQSTSRTSKANALLNEDLRIKRAKQVEIKAKHDKRKQTLWLCETLDEAKQIVGI